MKLRTTLNALMLASGLVILTHPVALGLGSASAATLETTSQVSMGALVVTALLFMVRRSTCDG